MKLKANKSEISFNEKGSLVSYKINTHEMLADGAESRPIFTFRFRDDSGKSVDVTAFDFQDIRCDASQNEVTFQFTNSPVLPITVATCAGVNQDGHIEFTFSVDNQTEYYIEYIDYPEITVPNNFVSDGGTAKLFWPAMEGCEVEDPAQRDSDMAAGFQYKPIAYPSRGWEGFYPGPTQMQFMAYYNKNAGFYFAAHDNQQRPKSIEYHKTAFGVRLEYRIFIAVEKHSFYRSDFSLVLQDGVSDWMDAAEIYRKYAEANYCLPNKLYERKNLPQWLQNCPIVLIYPVRGEKDTGQMNPNCFFPYENIMPFVEKYSEELHTQILVLLMHWEGTAPWAPPYIWPPYGGEELFRQFVEKIHASGNLVGLYASGIGWTDESVLWPEYTKKQFREENNLIDIMCAAPDQSVPHSLICNGPIRWGYDMCPTNRFVKECVLDEIAKVIHSNVDYLQYFDQNLGGTSCLCYSQKHNHIPVPGKWAVSAMQELFHAISEMTEKKGSSMVIGCEAAAAESYIDSLIFSDLRYNINYYYAKSVPAYAYVYHQYLFNFMGNENSFDVAVPHTSNPYSLHFRMAYSFVAGDLLTGVLNGKGEFFWDWGTVWSIESPDQSSLLKLVANLIKLRKTEAKEYLMYGRMIRPHVYQTEGEFVLNRKNGSSITYSDVLSSAWQAPNGDKVQIFVNYTGGDKKVTMDSYEFTVPEYSAMMIAL